MSDKVPDWITAEARKAQDAAIAQCQAEKLAVYEYPFASGRAKIALDDAIAAALLSAYRRGVEESAKVADDWIGGSEYIAAAIRRLGEAE